MKLNKEIRNQLLILQELNLIINSPDFMNATFDIQSDINNKKAKIINKLKFLYNLEEVIENEKYKENGERIRKMA